MATMDIKKIKGEMNATFQGQISQILRDTSNPDNPQWILYRILDGTGEIALFTDREYGYNVGEYVKVTDAWTRKNEKGLSANIKFDDQIEKLTRMPKKLKDRMSYITVLSLEGLKVSQKVQIPLKVIEIFPPQINKVESQKIRTVDITGRYNTIVLFGEEMKVAKKLKEDDFIVLNGVVGSYNDSLLLNIGPDGKIQRGKRAKNTSAGKLYFEHIKKTNTKVRKIIIERKTLAFQVAKELCSNFEDILTAELLPRLSTFVYYRFFKPKRYVEDYFEVLKQIGSGNGGGSDIPEEYTNYLKSQIENIYNEISTKIDLSTDTKSFVSCLIEMLYIFTIDLQNYLETFGINKKPNN